MKSLLPLLFGTLILSACVTTTTTTDPYYGAWYDAFGRTCAYSPQPGCDYYSNGMKIMVYQDPFYSLWLQDHSGFFWTSPTGIIYDQNGFALNVDRSFDETSNDVITRTAEVRDQKITEAGNHLASEYGLNTANAVQVARTLNEWAMLGKNRAKTDSDIADFSERLFGIHADKIAAALIASKVQNSLEPFRDLNTEVAAFWGTTPETSKQILTKWYQGELSR